MEIFILAILWFGSGFIGSCLYYAHFQRGFPLVAEKFRRSESFISLIIAVFGPFGLAVIAVFLVSESSGSPSKHGLAIPFTDPFKK